MKKNMQNKPIPHPAQGIYMSALGRHWMLRLLLATFLLQHVAAQTVSHAQLQADISSGSGGLLAAIGQNLTGVGVHGQVVIGQFTGSSAAVNATHFVSPLVCA